MNYQGIVPFSWRFSPSVGRNPSKNRCMPSFAASTQYSLLRKNNSFLCAHRTAPSYCYIQFVLNLVFSSFLIWICFELSLVSSFRLVIKGTLSSFEFLSLGVLKIESETFYWKKLFTCALLLLFHSDYLSLCCKGPSKFDTKQLSRCTLIPIDGM